jgi:hypothetical protein
MGVFRGTAPKSWGEGVENHLRGGNPKGGKPPFWQVGISRRIRGGPSIRSEYANLHSVIAAPTEPRPEDTKATQKKELLAKEKRKGGVGEGGERG